MTTRIAPTRSWTLAELQERLVRYEDLIPCRNAFIDTRNPGSEEKENFTIIGPGVSENPEQHVHIAEPHGFNIGAARQPPNCVNSQHSHDTAEVFVVHSGEWTFNFGEHGEAKIAAGPGTVASIPTGLFRGFSNVGEDEGFLWVALGGDDPGKVLWAPHVFDMASKFGLALLEDGSLVDTAAGHKIPVGGKLMPRTTPEQVARLASPALDDLRKCVLAPEHMGAQPLGPLAGAGIDERVLIGPGAQIAWPHGFTLSRVVLDEGAQTSAHRGAGKEVWFVHDGAIACNSDAGEVTMGRGDTFTVPEDLERSWTAREASVAFVVRAGDAIGQPRPA
jgi:quercetin dioxygenase-like cupin family protein